MTPDAPVNPPPAPPPPAARAALGFAGQYAAPDGPDEMLEADGSLRPHWRMFVNMLDDLGRDELGRRWEQARRLIHENGITHNVYGEANGLDRPWNLDFVPLLIRADEWRGVEQGMIQRAKLLDLLLADLYGDATCVAAGCLPAELLYANPGFIRACHGIVPPRGGRLHVYATDLVRSASGGFEVLADRTQAPSGAGYTLENRIVLSRVLPSVFRQCNVLRLAPFFVALRQTLSELAPANRENPRVVLLTPGPYNETYFEHAYLARYLGYTLVQGNDLTVRDNRVYLKTLGGLQRVDVILRRVDDDYCDPLELYPHSFLGVPGLVQAVREGNVAVANALGSGAVQAPAFLPFLPGLCRYFLGEELKLRSVETWWCGQPQAMAYVLEHLPRFVVKPAFPSRRMEAAFGADLSAAQLEQLAAKIRARPTEYVAQQRAFSHSAPVLVGDRVEARRFVVRSYLAASGDSYTVMAGGLTRITRSADSLFVSLQRGGGSKDTWVLSDGPVHETTLLPSPSQPVALSRGGGDLPSRVADDLFWLGRYVQRAEATIRLTRSALSRMTDQSGLESPAAAVQLARVAMGRGRGNRVRLDEWDLIAGVLSADRGDGLRSTVNAVHGLARVLRDRVSGDAWRILQNIEREVTAFTVPADLDQVAPAMELLNRLTVNFAAFIGLAADSMTRGFSRRFLDLGHRIERAIAVCRLLRGTLVDGGADDPSLLDAVLEVADSSLTYRRRYFTHLEATAVVDLLVADETNPRAMAFQVAVIEEHLAALPHARSHPHHNPDRQAALELRTMLKLADLADACAVVDGRRLGLDRLLDDAIEHLASISETLGQVYFSHANLSRQFISSAAAKERTS